MESGYPAIATPLHSSRRRFVKGLAAGGAAAALGVWPRDVRASRAERLPWGELRGNEFALRIGDTPMNIMTIEIA